MSYSSFKIEPLCKDNFDTWKIQVEALLTKNDGWKYVNGSFPKPENPPETVCLWESEDAKAKADLILLIATHELKQNKNCKTSKDVWDKLHGIYQSKGPARKAMLLKNLILLKMKNGDDIRDHIRNFFELEIIDDLLTILLLYSIPDEYESFRIAIETQEKLPTPEVLKIKLLEEYEARKRNTCEKSSDAMIAKKKNKKFFKTNENQQKKGEKFKFSCHNCGKIGHKAKDCWSKDQTQQKYVNKNPETTRNAEVALQVNGEGES